MAAAEQDDDDDDDGGLYINKTIADVVSEHTQQKQTPEVAHDKHDEHQCNSDKPEATCSSRGGHKSSMQTKQKPLEAAEEDTEEPTEDDAEETKEETTEEDAEEDTEAVIEEDARDVQQ